jgi:hypothetical protein
MPPTSRTWTEPLVTKLIKRHRGADPEEILERHAEQLRHDAEQDALPIDVDLIASVQGIRRRLETWDFAGRIYADVDGQLVMDLNADVHAVARGGAPRCPRPGARAGARAARLRRRAAARARRARAARRDAWAAGADRPRAAGRHRAAPERDLHSGLGLPGLRRADRRGRPDAQAADPRSRHAQGRQDRLPAADRRADRRADHGPEAADTRTLPRHPDG